MKIYLFFLLIIGSLMSNSLPKHYTKTLKNGLLVVAIPLNEGSGVVSTNIIYKVGSRNEVMGKSGIAHMLEHLNFKSTKNLKAGDFDKIVKAFGGVNNAYTSFDYTNYFINSGVKNLEKSFELYSEILSNLNLSNKDFLTERKVVKEERLWRTDNSPMGYLYFSLFNNAFVYHPYHWTPIGFMSDIENWKIEDIKDFHSIYYQAKNAILLVVGDINKDKVFSLADKYFSKIKNKKEIPSFYAKEPALSGSKRIRINKDSEVQMLAIAYRIPNFSHRDQFYLSVISEILSSGKSSRLYSRIVDEKNLANSIYAYNLSNIDPSLFVFVAVCNPNVKAEQLEREILSVIDTLKKENISEEELEKIKINVKADFIYSLTSASSVANLFSSYLAKGSLEPLLNFEKNLKKIKKEEIKKVALKYFNKNSVTIILNKED